MSMNRTLLILRHGKAEFSSSDGQDMSRRLSDRGHKEARLMGKVLRKTDTIPDRILCSPATRTRETTDSLLAKLRHFPEVVVNEGLYNASEGSLVQILRQQVDAVSLLLVGHNPGLEELVSHLIAPSNPPTIHLPTCGLARFDFEIDQWSELSEQLGRLVWLTTPDLLNYDNG